MKKLEDKMNDINEMIGRVRLDKTWYEGEDHYTDGDETTIRTYLR